ncbi:MAG: WYL domain-containing protein [Clostridiales Family XIII bacterium]|jgi:predicted DNA-binding transcriptional regulator YafY|nr:WYL domain-containing protein [Clostridiales Family XIII bacterium]
MAKNPNQKQKILYLCDMLLKETDDEHGLTMAQIIARLAQHGIAAERKSIYDDIDTLRAFGYDVLMRKFKFTEYYIGSREFEHPELTLLVDAVQSSKFLTEKKSNALIRKLESLTSIYEASSLKKQVHVADRIKMQNESIYYNVDAIQRAIDRTQQISFKYYDYNVQKDKVARKNDGLYVTNPIGLAYVGEYYYLITYNDHYGKFVNYRVDRMKYIKVSEEDAVRIPKGLHFDMAEYCHQSFSMYGGEETQVELTIDKSLVNPVIDRFGKDVSMKERSETTATVHVSIAASNVFFGWLAQFGDLIKIEAPESLAKDYVVFLKKIAKRYR